MQDQSDYIYPEEHFSEKMISIVPSDVAEDLEVVERSAGFKSWCALDKSRLLIAMKQLRNCSLVGHTRCRLTQSMGRLKHLTGKLPRNQRTIDRSIERLEEIL